MSLSKLPDRVLALVSSRLDGVHLVNLIRCGDIQLSLGLRQGLHEIQFEVNHIGFLAIHKVLHSINRIFPHAKSLVFVDTNYLGRMPKQICNALDLAKNISGIRLAVREFAYVGSGAFIDAMATTLSNTASELNDIFSKVERWAVQYPLASFVKVPHDAELNDSFSARDVVFDCVPRSATRISHGMHIVMDLKHSKAELERYATDYAETPLEVFHSSLLMSTNIFDSAAFQSLVNLGIVCSMDISTKILPRSLKDFYMYGANVETPSETFDIIMEDPPPNLDTLVLDGGCILVMNDTLPLLLEYMSVVDVIDPLYQLSVYTLPKSLRTMSLGQVATTRQGLDFGLDDDSDGDFAQHLFNNVADDTSWTKKWPEALDFDDETLWSQERDRRLITHYLRPVAHIPACNYTLQHLLLRGECSDLTKMEHLLKPKELMAILVSNASEDGIRLKGSSLLTWHSILQCPEENGFGRLFDTAITHMHVSGNTYKKIWALTEHVLDNIGKVCISLSSLTMNLENKHGWTNMCDFVVPAWVKSLTLDQMPGRPLNFACAENVACLKMFIPTTWTITKTYPSGNILGSVSLPSVFLALPPKLVTLQLFVSSTEDSLDCISKNLVAFLTFLPKTLLYLHVDRNLDDDPFWHDSPCLDNAAALLPLDLRLFNWSAYLMDSEDAIMFCRKVACIPSLFRLVMTYHLRHSGKQSSHCLELAGHATRSEYKQSTLNTKLKQQRIRLKRPDYSFCLQKPCYMLISLLVFLFAFGALWIFQRR